MERLKISDPRFNVREIAKQLILLEQHLLEKDKYCPDCITKHILTIEALADECQLLDSRQDWCALAVGIGRRARWWALAFAEGVSTAEIGQDVRAVRKGLAQQVLSPVEDGESPDLGGIFFAESGEAKPSLLLAGVGLLALAFWWGEKNYGPMRGVSHV